MSVTFEILFGRTPESAYFSPGRLNLLGEHTDYNGGQVLPAAIHLGNRFEVAPRRDGRVRIHSAHVNETVDLDIREPPPSRQGHWSDYVAGVLNEWDAVGEFGFDIAVFSTLPTGAGLSSSASITTGFAFLLASEWGQQIDRIALARLAQRVENRFIGLDCGILDQLSVALGQADHLLHIDCSTLEYKPVPFDSGSYTLLSAETGVPRSLAASHYNTRRRECESAAALLQKIDDSIDSLSRATLNDLAACDALQAHATLRARARHIVSENNRVAAAVRFLDAGDMAGVGNLMVESHRSLAKDYAVSCPELDIMVEEAMRLDGVVGAKMTGGGFGGAAVVLVETAVSESVRETLAAAYRKKAGITPSIIECRPAAGLSRIDTNG